MLTTIVIVVVLGLLTATLLVSLFGSSLDIHLIGTDTLTLTALAGSLLLTLLAALLLRLLLRTSALVERRKVDLTQHIQLRGILSHLSIAGSLGKL